MAKVQVDVEGGGLITKRPPVIGQKRDWRHGYPPPKEIERSRGGNFEERDNK